MLAVEECNSCLLHCRPYQQPHSKCSCNHIHQKQGRSSSTVEDRLVVEALDVQRTKCAHHLFTRSDIVNHHSSIHGLLGLGYYVGTGPRIHNLAIVFVRTPQEGVPCATSQPATRQTHARGDRPLRDASDASPSQIPFGVVAFDRGGRTCLRRTEVHAYTPRGRHSNVGLQGSSGDAYTLVGTSYSFLKKDHTASIPLDLAHLRPSHVACVPLRSPLPHGSTLPYCG